MEWNGGVDYWSGLLDWTTGGVWSSPMAHAHCRYPASDPASCVRVRCSVFEKRSDGVSL